MTLGMYYSIIISINKFTMHYNCTPAVASRINTDRVLASRIATRRAQSKYTDSSITCYYYSIPL